MAFSKEEQKIIDSGLQLGKNKQEIEAKIREYRSGKLDYAVKTVEKPSYLDRVGSEISSGVTRVAESVQAGAQGLEAPRGSAERATGAARVITGTPVGAAQVALSPITAAVQPIVEKGIRQLLWHKKTVGAGIEAAAETPTLQKIATNPTISSVLDKVLGGLDKVKQWATANPEQAKVATDAIELATLVVGAKPATQVVKSTVDAGVSVGRAIGSAIDDTIKNGIKVDIPVFTTVKTAEQLEQQALKASAELLQSGSKKSAVGRAAQFNNADVQAMRAIRDTLRPLKSQQELSDFFDDAIGVYTKNREDILRPVLSNAVDNSYQTGLKNEIRTLMRAKDTKTASAYAKILKQETEMFDSIAKQSAGGKATVEYLANRIKEINKKVESLYNDVGGKANLLPEQKIEVQAYEKLRQGLKSELDKIGGEQYAELGKVQSGLMDAREFARIQRDRAKNALTDTPWETMTLKERALFIKNLLPTLKDFGVNSLIKLDTKADVLDALVETKVRQIRQFGSQAIEQMPK